MSLDLPETPWQETPLVPTPPVSVPFYDQVGGYDEALSYDERVIIFDPPLTSWDEVV